MHFSFLSGLSQFGTCAKLFIEVRTQNRTNSCVNSCEFVRKTRMFKKRACKTSWKHCRRSHLVRDDPDRHRLSIQLYVISYGSKSRFWTWIFQDCVYKFSVNLSDKCVCVFLNNISSGSSSGTPLLDVLQRARSVLRLAPCLRQLKVSADSVYSDVWDLAFGTTRCAAMGLTVCFHMEKSHLVALMLARYISDHHV